LFAPLGEYDGMIRKLQVLQQCTMADQVSMEFGMDIHAKFHGHLICHSALLQDYQKEPTHAYNCKVISVVI